VRSGGGAFKSGATPNRRVAKRIAGRVRDRRAPLRAGQKLSSGPSRASALPLPTAAKVESKVLGLVDSLCKSCAPPEHKILGRRGRPQAARSSKNSGGSYGQ